MFYTSVFQQKAFGKHQPPLKKQHLVDHIEATAFAIAETDEVTSEQFHQIFVCKGVAKKIMDVLREETEDNRNICKEDLMSFILTLTLESNDLTTSTEQSIEPLETMFEKILGKNNQTLALEDFKKIIPSGSKDDFFTNQMFNIFDQDRSGHISQTEFIETIRQYSRKDDETKFGFLFRIYDVDGDGYLTENEFLQVITACMEENGLDFDKEDLSRLAHLLFIDGVEEGSKQMSLDCFHAQLQRHEELTEGLGAMINKWLVPATPGANRQALPKLYHNLAARYLSKDYWLNNKPSIVFVLVITTINLVLFTLRGYHFKNFCMLSGFTPNIFYVLSRACGRTLLFNSVLVLVLVLRTSITHLRQLGLSSFLPLDNNIYFHKIVGVLIFLQSLLHSTMHLANTATNIQPNPVKFLQLTYRYWQHHYHQDVLSLYRVPPGCIIVDYSSPDSVHCVHGSLDIPSGVNLDVVYNNGSFLCQACTEGGEPWTYAEWMLTMKPNMFGLISGIANPSGIALMCILTTMVICSLPFVRRRGHFEIFYFTHLLYLAYYILLLLHAPDFWKWFLPVGAVWVVERGYRIMNAVFGRGKTISKAGIILPSRVTNLIIERPPGFNFRAGDWVLVRIPALAWKEWHPFTISSAPEVTEHLTLHIRGVGEWTTRLYRLFEKEFESQKCRKTETILSIDGENDEKAEETNKITTTKTTNIISAKKLQETDEEREFQEVKSIINKENTRKIDLETPLDVLIDGPFGSSSSNIYEAEHAVLIGTGIGVTPFSSILQSIMHRYRAIKQTCPNCKYQLTPHIQDKSFKLKKVDFFWINRNQKSFEWFVHLLSQLETEQEEHGGALGRFLEMHMYVTSALHKTDMKSVALQLALDILYEKEHRDLVTGLKTRTNAGRPDWDKVFTKLKQEKRGQVTIFFCGNQVLGRVLRYKCEEFGFKFKKEVF